MRTDDSYSDWAVHYETCDHCRPDRPCRVGAEIQRRYVELTPETQRNVDALDAFTAVAR